MDQSGLDPTIFQQTENFAGLVLCSNGHYEDLALIDREWVYINSVGPRVVGPLTFGQFEILLTQVAKFEYAIVVASFDPDEVKNILEQYIASQKTPISFPAGIFDAPLEPPDNLVSSHVPSYNIPSAPALAPSALTPKKKPAKVTKKTTNTNAAALNISPNVSPQHMSFQDPSPVDCFPPAHTPSPSPPTLAPKKRKPSVSLKKKASTNTENSAVGDLQAFENIKKRKLAPSSTKQYEGMFFFILFIRFKFKCV